MFCSNCGQRLTDDAKHCPNCGVLIRRDTETEKGPDASYTETRETERPRVDQYNNSYGYTAAPVPTKADGYALTGLILAIVSGVCSCLPFIGLPCAVLGIIFSAKGMKSETRHTMAVIGLVLSIVFTACNLMTGFSAAVALARADTWKDILESAGYDFGFDFNFH